MGEVEAQPVGRDQATSAQPGFAALLLWWFTLRPSHDRVWAEDVARLRAAGLDVPVEEIMTSPAITVEPSTTIDEALGMMTRRRFRRRFGET